MGKCAHGLGVKGLLEHIQNLGKGTPSSGWMVPCDLKSEMWAGLDPLLSPDCLCHTQPVCHTLGLWWGFCVLGVTFDLFLSVLGLHRFAGAFSSCGKWGLLTCLGGVVVYRLLISVASCVEHGLWGSGFSSCGTRT